MKKRLISVFWVVLGYFAGACETEDCVSIANNDLLISFYDSDSTKLREVFFDYVVAEDNDSLLYSREKPSSSYAFPLNPAADETIFLMQVIDSVRLDTISLDPVDIDTVYVLREQIDTIWVEYIRKQRIITEECGVEISYGSLELKVNSFPGHEVVNNSLSRFNDVNIKIFF